MIPSKKLVLWFVFLGAVGGATAKGIPESIKANKDYKELVQNLTVKYATELKKFNADWDQVIAQSRDQNLVESKKRGVELIFKIDRYIMTNEKNAFLAKKIAKLAASSAWAGVKGAALGFAASKAVQYGLIRRKKYLLQKRPGRK